MKKKMGILAGLLMATVVTGYSVGGTYAKYTSSIDLADDARVARWSLSAKDSKNCTFDEGRGAWVCQPTDSLKLFAESYTYNGTEYVKAINAGNGVEPAKLLAPGTMGEYQVNLGGTIEVRYNLDIEFGMAKDENGDVIYDEPMVNYDIVDGKLVIGTGSNEYRPIKYAVEVFSGNTSELNTGKMSLADLQAALDAWNKDATKSTFAPGRMGRSVVISWSWDTTNKNVVANDGTVLTDAQVDALDTYIAEHWRETHEVATNPGNDLGDSVEYHLVVTATQVTAEEQGGTYSTNSNTIR